MEYTEETIAEYLERTGKHLEDLLPEEAWSNDPEQNIRMSYGLAENLYRLFMEEPGLVAEGRRGDFVLLGNGRLLGIARERSPLVHQRIESSGSSECFLIAKVGYHNYDHPEEIIIKKE